MPDSRVAWVFPGQGSQEPGMGREIYEREPAAREVFDRADRVLGRAISRLCFEGSAEELGKTSNSQPAIYVTSMAFMEAARASGRLGDAPAFVAGHSLGEYSALTAVGALALDDGLRLVEARGRATQAAADARAGKMAAILGLDEEATEAVCREAGAELCNINAPGQIVIGGTVEAIERACKLAVERGARRAMPLDVGGAFHTSLMQPAVETMRAELESTTLRDTTVPIVTNDTGEPRSKAAEIRDELLYQLTHPVRWVRCVEHMAEAGVTTFIEIGPGRVLSGLIKRIAPAAATVNINGIAALTA
ncbi:MAG TPA: ACP S-malonyltransferase [Dehalococcoidia bacterium]|nr:ACP S-malonyltransferase [Dehalococcoidia bacterium]